MFGEKLREMRTKKGLTQVQLAKLIGVSRDLYNKYERAGTRPSHETLVLLARALDTSVDYLIGNTNEEIEADSVHVEISKDVANDLDRTLRVLELQQDGLMFMGHPMNNETRTILISNIRHTIELGNKFTSLGLPTSKNNIDDLWDEFERKETHGDFNDKS